MADKTEQLWQSFSGRMRSFIARRVENEADVDDILQDVFLKVHDRLGTLKRTDRTVPWLFQITRTCIIDYYRSPRRRREAPLVVNPDGDIEGRRNRHVRERAADTKKAVQELSSCLVPMIHRLPEEYRKAISLVALHGISQHGAAKRLGLSHSGMKSRVQRGREKLKAMLGQCCHIELDRQGRIFDYESKTAGCRSCGSASC